MLFMNPTSEFTIYLGIPQTMKQTHNVKADLQGTVHHGSAEGRRHTVTATAGWPFWAVQWSVTPAWNYSSNVDRGRGIQDK